MLQIIAAQLSEILGAVCTQRLRLLRAILQFLAGQTMRNHNVARTLKFSRRRKMPEARVVKVRRYIQ